MRHSYIKLCGLVLFLWWESAYGTSVHKEWDLQFFGDTHIPDFVLRITKSDADQPKLFEHVQPLLNTSHYNIINLEGVITTATVPFEMKSFLLRMPLSIPQLLRNAHINVATLANNHTMDFGYQGLFDTLTMLRNEGIIVGGAGSNLEEAIAPIILPFADFTVCIVPFSRSLPTSFWAEKDKPGTAALNFSAIREHVKQCVKQNHITIVSFHWGQELRTEPKDYQRKLAQLVIDQGASAVIGHHPHIIQSIEFYKDKPILYSIGNFAFGTYSKESKHGLAMSLKIQPKTKTLRTMLTTLYVDNNTVKFKPQLSPSKETKQVDVIKPHLPPNAPCKKSDHRWYCDTTL